MKKLLTTIISALLCLCIIIFGMNVYGDVFGTAGAEVELVIPEGTTGGEIVNILKKDEVFIPFGLQEFVKKMTIYNFLS